MNTSTIEKTKIANESVTVTPKAVQKIKQSMAVENKDSWYLRLGVEGGGCSGLNYKMTFEETQGIDDKLIESNGLKILCNLQSWLYLHGLEIDYSDEMLNGGFKIHNPNAQRTCGCGTSFSV